MVLAQKKFPTCVYIVHTLDNLHYSQQGYAFLINWNLVLGHGHTRQFFVTFTAIFANLAIHRDWLDDKYFVGGRGGAGRARPVNDVG